MTRRLFAFSITLLLTVIPIHLFAKGDTSKITIQGGDLKKPVEITDPKVLANFVVWGGFNSNSPSFIVDSSQGKVAEPPAGFPKYQVSFYAKMRNEPERLVYVATYALDAAGHGYVYLPGKRDKNYWLDVGTIFRGIEGSWFHSWSVWDSFARPLIAMAK